jgi:hypothetical protein
MTTTEPLLVAAMRRADPTDHVRIPKSGTSIGGFLSEYDEAVTQPLRDLQERLVKAGHDLDFFVGGAQRDNDESEEIRLKGKAEGVRLALSYVEESLR